MGEMAETGGKRWKSGGKWRAKEKDRK